MGTSGITGNVRDWDLETLPNVQHKLETRIKKKINAPKKKYPARIKKNKNASKKKYPDATV